VGGVGSVSASMLATASSEGRENYWSASNLRKPVESVVIDANQSCLEVLHSVSESLICGHELGGLHAVLPGWDRLEQEGRQDHAPRGGRRAGRNRAESAVSP